MSYHFGVAAIPPAPDQKLLEDALRASRDGVAKARKAALLSYWTLKDVYRQLGRAFPVAPPTTEGSPIVGWNQTQQGQLENLNACALAAVKFADEALSGQRPVTVDATQGLVIGSLPADIAQVVLVEPGPLAVLVDKQGQPVEASGTLGLAWAAVIATVAIAAAAYGIITAMCNSAQTQAEEETKRVLAEKQQECLANGTCKTPEQAASLASSIYGGAAQVAAQKAREQEAGPLTKLAETANTFLYIVLAVGLGFLALQFLPKLAAGAAKKSEA